MKKPDATEPLPGSSYPRRKGPAPKCMHTAGDYHPKTWTTGHRHQSPLGGPTPMGAVTAEIYRPPRRAMMRHYPPNYQDTSHPDQITKGEFPSQLVSDIVAINPGLRAPANGGELQTGNKCLPLFDQDKVITLDISAELKRQKLFPRACHAHFQNQGGKYRDAKWMLTCKFMWFYPKRVALGSLRDTNKGKYPSRLEPSDTRNMSLPCNTLDSHQLFSGSKTLTFLDLEGLVHSPNSLLSDTLPHTKEE
ncbi:hypothetical protein PR048_025590 [Dryococelus australis]|uniref:Uncharacterized protein n=1 Tax=Dryococelus australis TaxID=614101 RepID=A0ABQ9GRW7_9NEOP|nr:hypothetical protein PR048_025590 [Dryococelus australis]